jgi:LysM repeat protein
MFNETYKGCFNMKTKKISKLLAGLTLAGIVLNMPSIYASQFTYTIKSGDTLTTISNTYKTTVTNIMQDNNIINANNIYAGEPLRINMNGFYTVQAGDSLYTIAKKYNSTITDLTDYNNLSITTLNIGQVLRVVPNDVTVDLDPAVSYIGQQNVNLQSSDVATTVYYTMDGSEPQIGGVKTIQYNGKPIALNSNTQIKAIAVKNTSISNTVSFNYSISSIQVTPSVASGTEVPQNKIIYLNATDSRASIYYTLDGSNPDAASVKYNPLTGIKLAHTTYLKAVAVYNGNIVGDIAKAFYPVTEMTGLTMKNATTAYDIFYGQQYTLNYLFNRYGTLPSEVRANNSWIQATTADSDSLYNLYGYRWISFPIRRYTVNKGDTLHNIAVMAGNSVDDIIKVNSMKSDTIYEGQYIYLPKAGYNTRSWTKDSLALAKKPTAPAEILPPTWVTSDPRYNLSSGSSQYEQDMYWLKQVVQAESGGEPYAGQQAVGIVLMNRLARVRAAYQNYSIGIKDIVFEYDRLNPEDMYPSNQFEPVINQTIYNVVPSQTAADASAYAYNKNTSVNYNGVNYYLGTALYFINPNVVYNSWLVSNCTLVATIKNHDFYAPK